MADLMIRNARLAFPNLLEPSSFTEKYGCVLLFEPTNPAAKEIEKIVTQVATDKFRDKAASVIKSTKASNRYPLHDGDEKADYAGYEGMKFINANSRSKIRCYNPNRTAMTEEEMREKMYSGAVVNALVSIYAFANSYGKGFGVEVRGLQFVKDADRFSGGSPASGEDFPEIEEQDGDIPW